jgi:chaperonin GroEL
VIRVGGASEVEVKERKDRVDDAMHATRAAVEEGIVPGGGVALARASLILSKVKTDNDDQRFGLDIVRKALQTPLRQIAENAGEDGAVIAGKVLDNQEYNWGFDAQAGEFKDLVKSGIIDPTKVVHGRKSTSQGADGLVKSNEAAQLDFGHFGDPITSLEQDTIKGPIIECCTVNVRRKVCCLTRMVRIFASASYGVGNRLLH